MDPQEAGLARRFVVQREQIEVLAFEDTPGVLLSTAVRPPGFEPPEHPFLSGQALDPNCEDQLAQLLGQASSVDAFVDLLRDNGFEVHEEPAGD
jgi:hypothetical protein